MFKRILSVVLCLATLASASLVMAGGPPAPVYYAPAPGCVPAQPCGPYPANQYYQPNAGAYWGDAPFPGLCGGVVALPFLVVGSLLGGNTAGAYGPPPRGARVPVPCPPVRYAPPPPVCGPGYGPAAGPANGGGLFSGLPCLELCGNLLGSVTGGMGFGIY